MAGKYDFSTQPSNMMGGLQMLNSAFQRKENQAIDYEKGRVAHKRSMDAQAMSTIGLHRSLAKEKRTAAIRKKATAIYQSGDTDAIAKFAGEEPEAKGAYADIVGSENASMLDTSKKALLGTDKTPEEVHIEAAEKDIADGKDPAGNLEMARALMGEETRAAATKQHESVLAMLDPAAYRQYKGKQATGGDGRTAEIKNYEYGLENPEFAALKIKADENKLTKHELRLATMLANGEIDASQLPKRGNTYNKIVAGAKELNPELDIRSATADYALSKNPAFRQKAMTAEVLPDIMKHVVDAGKKVDFSNIRKIGGMQKFYKENINDPDFVEYMALRNDALMEIASVMRGGGMTDKAHEAEVEAMNPTMSPRALDAWIKAQNKALKPRLTLIRKIISGKGKPTPDGEMTKEEHAKLPSGATYTIGGKTYRKK